MSSEIYQAQDDCLIPISGGKVPEQKYLELLPPWRAVLIARVANQAGLMSQEEVQSWIDRAQRMSETGIDLHGTTDAEVWASEFCRLHPEIDKGLMIGWFANAIETGRTHGTHGSPTRGD